MKLRLSDLFVHPDDSHEFEWMATMYNLNKGKNDALLSSCKPLSDYMTLVNYIRENQSAGMSVKKACFLWTWEKWTNVEQPLPLPKEGVIAVACIMREKPR